MIRKSLIVAFVFILGATNSEAQKNLDEPFDLGVGESVLIVDAGIRVGFDHTTSDSRCPTGAVCIWEGNAVARIWGEVAPEDRTFFDLNTNAQFRTEVVYLGFIIRLLGVAPYPEEGIAIDPNQYVVTVVVTREGTIPVRKQTWGAIKALYR